MLGCSRRLVRVSVLLGVWFIAGCVVEAPQPTPTPAPKGPAPVAPAPSTTPPGSAVPAPKIYTGSYPDRLEAAARDALVGTSIRVQRNTNTIKLIIPASAAFTANSAQLQSRFSVVLDNIGRLCREYNKTAITVKGFTDSTGSFEHNQHLSGQRAQSIGAYLSRDVGSARINTVGYGPRYPIADNKTDAGRMQNRRIEIELVTAP